MVCGGIKIGRHNCGLSGRLFCPLFNKKNNKRFGSSFLFGKHLCNELEETKK